MITDQSKWRPVLGVVAAWFVTRPCAALLAAAIIYLIQSI